MPGWVNRPAGREERGRLAGPIGPPGVAEREGRERVCERESVCVRERECEREIVRGKGGERVAASCVCVRVWVCPLLCL